MGFSADAKIVYGIRWPDDQPDILDFWDELSELDLEYTCDGHAGANYSSTTVVYSKPSKVWAYDYTAVEFDGLPDVDRDDVIDRLKAFEKATDVVLDLEPTWFLIPSYG